jgi:hypothetical protein
MQAHLRTRECSHPAVAFLVQGLPALRFAHSAKRASDEAFPVAKARGRPDEAPTKLALSQPPRNSSPRRVVRRDLDTHPISVRQADMMNAQPAASLRKHRVSKRTGSALDGVKPPPAAFDDSALKDKIVPIARLGSYHPCMLAHWPTACCGAFPRPARSDGKTLDDPHCAS